MIDHSATSGSVYLNCDCAVVYAGLLLPFGASGISVTVVSHAGTVCSPDENLGPSLADCTSPALGPLLEQQRTAGLPWAMTLGSLHAWSPLDFAPSTCPFVDFTL